MNRYTVNFICEDKEGHKVVRSEEIIWTGVKEAIEIIKKENQIRRIGWVACFSQPNAIRITMRE